MSDGGKLYLSGAIFGTGCIFRFGLDGYEFLGYALMVIALVMRFYHALAKMRDKYPKIERVLNKTMSYFIVLFCMVFAITEGAIYYGSFPSETQKTDYVLLLGTSVKGVEPSKTLEYRLETALEYMNEHPDAVCVATGCQGRRERISEAECMANWLTEKGIAPERIILEDRATRTRENIEYSAELIEQQTGTRPEAVTIITSEFHMLRSAMLTREYGMEPVCVPAATRLPLLRVSCYIREALAIWKFYIFG